MILMSTANDSRELGNPVSSWLARIAMTLTFRSGVYTEMNGDRHATWQPTVTWIAAALLLTVPGPKTDPSGVLGRALFWASVALVVWAAFIYVFGARVFKGAETRRFTKSVRIVGFSLTPQLGVYLIPASLSAGPGLWVVLALVVWMIAIQLHGTRETFQLSWPKSFTTVLIPWALLLAGLVFLAFLAAMFAYG